MRAISIAKPEEGYTNEDAARATPLFIAVSDGAGGGGVFADRWADYLVTHLPDSPLTSYEAFDAWVNDIWEPFYNDSEAQAKAIGEMFLSKFYDEGSFATLAVAWRDGQWMTYGDSVAFCYDPVTDSLQHSFGHLIDFNYPPYLINCKDPTTPQGFRSGTFQLSPHCIRFTATDALSHYILMMYCITHRQHFEDALHDALIAKTKNSNFISTALASSDTVFYSTDSNRGILNRLLNCHSTSALRPHLMKLLRQGLIALDDYSLATM